MSQQIENPSAMTVRQAGPADIPKIVACARAAYAMYVLRIGREPAPMVADFAAQVAKGMIYVIGDNDDVDGFVVFYPRGDHMHLENVAVLPQYKGKGLGRQLMAFVEHEAERQGSIWPTSRPFVTSKAPFEAPWSRRRIGLDGPTAIRARLYSPIEPPNSVKP